MIEEYRQQTNELSHRDKLLEAQRLVSEVSSTIPHTWKYGVSKGKFDHVSKTILEVVADVL